MNWSFALHSTPAGDKLLEEICSFQADFVFCVEYLFVCTFKQQSKATIMFSGVFSFQWYIICSPYLGLGSALARLNRRVFLYALR